MNEHCQKCGKEIAQRAKANVWQEQWVVCTACLRELKDEVKHQTAIASIAGMGGAPWLVHDGRKQWGPYSTDQLIELLTKGQVDRFWNVWREGMRKWMPVGQLFTVPELSNGKVELRDFGQGDGTYRA